jgi:hypothetical protein
MAAVLLPTRQALLAAPSSSTAGNLVRLLKDGLLGLALPGECGSPGQSSGGPSAPSAAHPPPHLPVLTYVYHPGALPSQLLRPDARPHHQHGPTATPSAQGQGQRVSPPECWGGTNDPGALPVGPRGRGGAQGQWDAPGPELRIAATEPPCEAAEGRGGQQQQKEEEEEAKGEEDWRAALFVGSHDGGGGGSCSGSSGSGAGAGPSSSSGCFPSPGPSHVGGVRLGVRAASLEQLAVGDPEDVQQRAWQVGAGGGCQGVRGETLGRGGGVHSKS